MKETCPNCKSERYESINLHVSDVEYAFLHGDKFGKIDLNVCRDCGIVYLKREQFEKINKKRPEEIVGSQEYYYHKYNIKEEAAEWHKEFGNITRTETLKLPTWEELKNKTEHYISFSTKRWTKCWLAIYAPSAFMPFDASACAPFCAEGSSTCKVSPAKSPPLILMSISYAIDYLLNILIVCSAISSV